MTEKKVTSEEKDFSKPANLALKLGTIVHSGVYRATAARPAADCSDGWARDPSCF